MTPIESKDDIRLAVLVGTLTNLAEQMAIEVNKDPELIIAEAMFRQLIDTTLINKITTVKYAEEFYPTIKTLLADCVTQTRTHELRAIKS